jgi:hypothetical protein
VVKGRRGFKIRWPTWVWWSFIVGCTILPLVALFNLS